MKKIFFLTSIVLVVVLQTGCSSVGNSFLAYKAEGITLDGCLNEKSWDKAEWINLDGCKPEKVRPVQGENPIKAAFLWNERGLYVGAKVTDQDVQANKTIKNDWIWLEDVCEVFFCKSNTGLAPHLEIQVSANGTVYEELLMGAEKNLESVKASGYIPKYKVAVNVNGTLNNSAEKDIGWSAEWFIPWNELKKAQVLAKGFKCSNGTIASYSRISNWNIDIYTYHRVLRYTQPGNHVPHYPEKYRKIILK